jgi:large subunit ribosomal protein L35
MPKMKSGSGAKKRFKVTGTGKIARHKSCARHILTKKSPKRKRGLRKGTLVSHADKFKVARLLQG